MIDRVVLIRSNVRTPMSDGSGESVGIGAIGVGSVCTWVAVPICSNVRRSSAPASPAKHTACSTSGTVSATNCSPCSPTWPTTLTSPTWRHVTRWCGPTCSVNSACKATPSPWNPRSPVAWPNGGAGFMKSPSATPAAPTWKGRRSRPSTGAKVFWEWFRCRCLDPQFTHHRGFYLLKSIARVRKYNRWLLATVPAGSSFRGAGTGRGNRQL